MQRAGKMRQWVSFQSRDGAESGTTDATVTYTTIKSMRMAIKNVTGAQMVGTRGRDTENTHRFEGRLIPAMSTANYILIMGGPDKGLRVKFDSVQNGELGRDIVIRGYPIGDKDAFVQPSKGSLPEII